MNVSTVYIFHQAVLIAFNVQFLGGAIASILTFNLVSLITVPLCFWLPGLIRKLPGAKRVLGKS